MRETLFYFSTNRLFSAVLCLLITSSLGSQLWAEDGMITVEGFDLSFKSSAVFEDGEAPDQFVLSETFRLSETVDGVFGPHGAEGATPQEFSLTDAPSGQYKIDAIRDLQSQVVNALGEAGYYGIVVLANPEQVDPRTGEDLRETSSRLTLDVWFNEVVEVRSVGKGKRLAGGNPLNNALHRRIRDNSPIMPELVDEAMPEEDQSSEGSEEEVAESSLVNGVLIDKPALDSYLERLNRHPGRRVDAALSSAGKPGAVVLDYIVNEPKPWVVYAQLSNTGTESTGEWRQRIGGSHYQLTGNDDVLTVDFLTAELDRANAFSASYEYPVIFPDYLKARVYGSYSDFAAENLLISAAQDFEGDTTIFGGELRYTPFYFWGHAFTLYAGIEYEDISVENLFGAAEGEVDLLKPFVGFEVSKSKQVHRSLISVGFEFNADTGTEDADIIGLGRLNATDDYDLVTFDFFQSFYLEPLLPGYKRPNPNNWFANALVHEFAFSVRGQYALDDVRTIPQKQIFGGGFFSVRGYEESVARGDNGLIASAEYRMHIARMLKPSSLIKDENLPAQQEPQSGPQKRNFNYRAPDLYALPDWDLLLRGFVDYATFDFNDPNPDELTTDLVGAGVGLEFQYKSSFNIRLDYGVVLEDLEDFVGRPIDNAQQGDSRFHLVATFTY